MHIRLSENFRAVFYAPFYATLALGLFKQQGLDIELVDSPSPGSGIADMEKGLIDVVWGGPLRVIKQRDSQAPSPLDLVAFCEVAAKDPFFLVGRPQTSACELGQLQHLRMGTVSEVPTCAMRALTRWPWRAGPSAAWVKTWLHWRAASWTWCKCSSPLCHKPRHRG